MAPGDKSMQNRVVVELDLDETVERGGQGITPATYRLHARTRFVSVARPQHTAPEVGDPWCELTVRARLHRMADVFKRLPHTSDTRPGGYKSCMPDPVRELFKDLPGEPMRLGVAASDMSAARQALDGLWMLDREGLIVAWGIAARLSDRRVAKELGCHHTTAAARKQDVLGLLAAK
jgi:hypothetical protein